MKVQFVGVVPPELQDVPWFKSAPDTKLSKRLRKVSKLKNEGFELLIAYFNNKSGFEIKDLLSKKWDDETSREKSKEFQGYSDSAQAVLESICAYIDQVKDYTGYLLINIIRTKVMIGASDMSFIFTKPLPSSKKPEAVEDDPGVEQKNFFVNSYPIARINRPFDMKNLSSIIIYDNTYRTKPDNQVYFSRMTYNKKSRTFSERRK